VFCLTVFCMDKIEMLLNRIVPEEEVNWDLVRQIVEGYAERHPEEFMGCTEYVKTLRRAAKDTKYGTMEGSGSEMRHIYELPDRLARGLTIKYPSVLSGRNLRYFLKLYPIFQIPEKL